MILFQQLFFLSSVLICYLYLSVHNFQLKLNEKIVQMSTVTIDRVMELVGNKNRYQLLTIVFFAFVWMQLTFLLLGPSFIYMNPYFKCDFQQDFATEEQACPRIKQCTLQNKFTITGFAQLYCDRQTERNVVQSIYYLGAIAGLVLMNILADTKGRRYGIFISLVSCVFGVGLQIFGAYQKSVILLSFGQIFNGFGSYSLMILSYIYVYDVCDQKTKQRAIIGMSGLLWGSFQMFFCVLFYFLNEWYNLLVLLMFIPLCGITIISTFFIVQTPMFLYYKKRDIKGCIQALQIIAIYNDKQENLDEVSRIIQQDQQNLRQIQNKIEQKKQASILQILRNSSFVKLILAIAIIQFSVNMFYYGVQYSLQQNGTSYGINVLFTGFIEVVGNTISIILIDKVPRRKGLAMTNSLIIIMGLFFCLPFISSSKVVGTILLALCRICTTFSQALIPLLQIQSFPSTIQSTGTGLIEALSQLGNFATPFIVTIATNAGINPVIIVSLVVLVVGILPLKFVKQTYKPSSKNKESVRDSLKDSLVSDQKDH